LRSSRWLAPAALLAAFGAITALALGELTTSSGRAPDAVAHSRPHRPSALSAAARGGSRQAPSTRTVRDQPPPVTPVSETLAAQLEAQGHELLEAGRYEEAVQILNRAVTATGEQVEECLQPASETCLTYAYALYDLGRALQLDGHPAAAVPVLQRRLQIDNQRPTVADELQRARAQTG
jgi:tetratricopeptide (TPR) repeat protein